jgi:hypothetical protein
MKPIFTIVCLIIAISSFAQQRNCGFNDECTKMGVTTREYELLTEKLSFPENQKLAWRDEIVIPLVFHVFNRTDAIKKIGESEVYYQIDKLNEAFSGENYDLSRVPQEFLPFIGKSNIRFCLGYQIKDGKKERGIIFKTTDIENFGDELTELSNQRKKVKHDSYGGSDQWDSNIYINVWVSELSIFDGKTDPLGLPVEFKNEEGIVIDPETIDISKKGKVLVHEMGHYFSLLHIWGNKNDECAEDDGVSDTPMQSGPYYGCPHWPQYSCNTSNMYVNYMDYTDEYCSLMFTKEQVLRMENWIYFIRPELVKQEYCYSFLPGENFLNDIYVLQNGGFINIIYENMVHPDIKISLYSVSGKKVLTSVIKDSETSYSIDNANISSGIYILYLETENICDFRKLAIFKS